MEQLCPAWFICTDNGNILKTDQAYIIKKFTTDIEKESQLDGYFNIEFEQWKVEHVELFEEFFINLFLQWKDL